MTHAGQKAALSHIGLFRLVSGIIDDPDLFLGDPVIFHKDK